MKYAEKECTYYYIVGDRSNPWIHKRYPDGEWFHRNPESEDKTWREGKINPVGRKMSHKEYNELAKAENE